MWNGNYLLTRFPFGSLESDAEQIPKGKGMYEVQGGHLVFGKDDVGNDFKILRYNGKDPIDLCQLLRDSSD